MSNIQWFALFGLPIVVAVAGICVARLFEITHRKTAEVGRRREMKG